jgi:hypothetical protein
VGETPAQEFLSKRDTLTCVCSGYLKCCFTFASKHNPAGFICTRLIQVSIYRLHNFNPMKNLQFSIRYLSVFSMNYFHMYTTIIVRLPLLVQIIRKRPDSSHVIRLYYICLLSFFCIS